jgi:hypothetical protein
MSFLPLVEAHARTDPGDMMLLVFVVLLLLAWAVVQFGPDNTQRYRC